MIKTLSARTPAKLSRQLLAIVVGSISAIVANVILYLILKNLVGVDFVAPSESQSLEVSPLPYTDVIIFSTIYCAGASIVFLITANMARRPAVFFVGISTVVLLLSLIMPLMIPTPPIPMTTRLSLAAMHILGAAVLIPLLVIIGLPITHIDPQKVSEGYIRLTNRKNGCCKSYFILGANYKKRSADVENLTV